MPRLSDLLDPSIDAAAVDGRQVTKMRIAVAALAAGVLAANLGLALALAWLAVVVAFELLDRWITRSLAAGIPGSPGQRLHYLAESCAGTLTWTAFPILFWFSHRPALQIAAVIILAGQLIHAQAFAFRSKAVLVVNGGVPALALAILPTCFGRLSAMEALTVALCVLGTIAYAVASARSNAAAHADLLRERRQAEDATRAKSAFLAMISHELRTPLNGVLGMAQALKLTGLDPRQAQCTETIVGCADDLLVLLNDILDLSKIEAGKLELDVRPFDLSHLMHAVVDLWSPTAQAKGVRLYCEGFDAPHWLLGDALRVKQIALNLVSNALKFTHEGEVRIELTARPGADGESKLQIAVHDTGMGMTPAQQTRLFQDYVQADSSTSARFGGTGLGLSICRRLCTLMGGDIGVTSEAGRGSMFWVLLDLPPVDAGRPEDGCRSAAVDLAGRRVLVVDDNATNRAVASAILGAVGLVVETADDAVQALDRLRWGTYTFVLTDIHMPGMDGLEMTRRIRRGEAGPPDILIIALTGDVDLPLNDFDAVQPKPIRPESLLAALDWLLQKTLVPPAAGMVRQTA